MVNVSRAACLCAAAAFLAGCGAGNKRPPAALGQTVPPVLGWRLPKTVLDVTVTYVPVNCIDTAAGPLIKVKATAEAVARAVPDPDLGSDFPNGLVRVDTGDLASFWTDASVGYTLHPDSGGLLKTLSSHPVNQTGTIIGNFLTGATKLATAALVPAPLTTGLAKCGHAFTKLKEIAKIKARIPGEAKQKAEDDAQRIVTLREAITVVVKRTIDTAVTPPDEAGIVSRLSPDLDEAVARGWKTLKGTADPRHIVYVILDFEHGNLLQPLSCGGGAATCPRTHSELDRAGLFRQAAYVPVLFRLAEIDREGQPVRENGRLKFASNALAPVKIISFGQYGIPRTLPLKVGAFRDTNWSLEFSQAGEITSTVFGNKATGVGVSSAFSGAATAISELDAIPGKAAAALDTDTLRLQAENARLKAETDNYDLKAKKELQDAAEPDE
jgi:hypothetical protein